MFGYIKLYKDMIIAGVMIALLTGLYFYVHSLKSQIFNLRSELKTQQIELANNKLQSERYKNSLDKQNHEIECFFC